MESFDQKHAKEIGEQAQVFALELKEIHALHGTQYVLDLVYNLVEQVQSNTEWNKNTSCSKGCSFCCHDEINISDWEAERIIENIKDYNPDMNLLKIQNSVDDISKLPWKDQKCSLLDKEGNCSVYENRPLVCRTHNSIDEPQLCHLDNNPTKGHGQIFTIPTQALHFAMLIATTDKFNKMHKILFNAKS